ncbi:MAG: hypothetical protein ACODAB_09175 [Gemmatimonadota bacterium]
MKFRITDGVPKRAPYEAGQIVEPAKNNLPIWRRRSWAVPVRGEDAETATARPAPENAARRTTAPDPEALPDGYSATHVAGGYFRLRGPDGAVIDGPSNGKWQGKDGAAKGARAHARREASGE